MNLKSTIDPNKFELNYLNISPNHVRSNDGHLANIFGLNQYTFFEVLLPQRNSVTRPKKENLWKTEMFLEDTKILHFRNHYTILEILGHIGGL